MTLEPLWQDVRYGARMLARTPGFTAVAVLTLAIGLGASTAIFSQINAVFWNPLPAHKPEELRTLVWTSPRHPYAGAFLPGPHLDKIGDTNGSFSYPTYLSMRDGAKSFSSMACWLDPGENRPVVMSDLGLGSVQFVSGNYFETLGVSAAIGRTIGPDDDKYGAGAPVAMLSYPLWQRAFGSDPNVIKQTLLLNGRNFAIIGVMPKGFFGFDPGVTPDVMVPVNMIPIASAAANPLPITNLWTPCRIIARLRSGVSDEQARADAEGWVAEAIKATPPTQPYELPHLWILDGSQGMNTLRDATSGPLLITMAVVAGILLIACANIAGLLLARGSSRQREIATRLALGAPRNRLVRQLVTESLLLSAIGGVVGMFLAYALGRIMPGLLGQFAPLNGMKLNGDYLHSTMFGLNKSVGVDASLDFRVLLFSGGLIVLTGLIFGLVPALRATRLNLISMIKQSASSNSSGRRTGFTSGKAMVSVQAALSMLLLVGAGLFIRTVVNLRSANLGYRPEGLLYVRLEPRMGGYTPQQRTDYFENALHHLETMPGVVSASGSFFPPMGSLGADMNACTPDLASDDPRDRAVTLNVVSPRFFETMKVPLMLGRDFNWSDRSPEGIPVAIVNQAFATKYYSGKNPVGQRLGLGNACPADPGNITVVGVVADSRSVPRREAGPTVYTPIRQGYFGDPLTIAVRTSGDPTKMIPTIRKAIGEIDSRVPAFGEVSPVALRDQQISRESTLTNLLVFFGAVALLLSCLGIYGLLTYTVSRRTSEIGLRMALGAQRSDVIRLVLRESLIPVAIGIAVGMAGSMALSRMVESVLYGVSRNDPFTMAAAIVLFLLIGSIAAALPAERASRIDPKIALRYD